MRSKQLDDMLASGKMLLVLDRVTDPGNIGTMLRTADAAGVGGLLLLPDEFVDAVACYTDCFGINGDVDGDGKVTVADAILVARYAISAGELSNEGNALQLADFNCDGFVNIVDTTLIARAALGLN